MWTTITQSVVAQRWDAQMRAILMRTLDLLTPFPLVLAEVFHLDENEATV